MIGPSSRPRLAAKARLRVDPRSGKHMLLYPERGLELSETAARIAKLCGNGLTVAGIIERLASAFADADHQRIEDEVMTFLRSLEDRGLLALDEASDEASDEAPDEASDEAEPT